MTSLDQEDNDEYNDDDDNDNDDDDEYDDEDDDVGVEDHEDHEDDGDDRPMDRLHPGRGYYNNPRWRPTIPPPPAHPFSDHGLLSDSLTEDDDDDDDDDDDIGYGHHHPSSPSPSRRRGNISSTSLLNQFNGYSTTAITRTPPTTAKATTTTTTPRIPRSHDREEAMDVDLERILREDEDEEEEDDDDHNMDNDSASDHLLFHTQQQQLHRHSHHPPQAQARTRDEKEPYDIDNDDDDDDNYNNNNNDQVRSYKFTPPMGIPEDWHVLQAILGEDDDEDLMDATPHRRFSNHVPVDTILQQSDEDDDEDDDDNDLDDDTDGDLDTTLNDPGSLHDNNRTQPDSLLFLPKYIPQLHVPLQQEEWDRDADVVPLTHSNESFQTAHEFIADNEDIMNNNNHEGTPSPSFPTPTPTTEHRTEAQRAKASERAMHYTQQYEARLLRAHATATTTTGTTSPSTIGPGAHAVGTAITTPAPHFNLNKDIVSPLMVKRRLKPKVYLQSKSFLANKQSSHYSISHNKGHKTNSNSHNMTAASSLMASSVAAVPPTPSSTTASSRHLLHPHTLTTATGAVEFRHMPGVSATLAQQFKSSSSSSSCLPPHQRQPPTPSQQSQPPHRDLPTALGMNDRFLAVGMQSGVCLIFDLFETFRKKLDKGGDTPFESQTAGAVTTLDLSFEQGEILVAGYTSGYVVLWDVLRGVALRTVIESTSPPTTTMAPPPPSCMTHVRFLKGLDVVTVDAGGLVNKLHFSKNLLWPSYSVESECLLDGTAGQILAMNVLDPTHNYNSTPTPTHNNNNNNSHIINNNNNNNSIMHPKGLVLIALSSERSSFAVAVAPAVHVLYRWPKPSLESVHGRPTESTTTTPAATHSNQVYLPCLSWGWALVSGGDNVKTPILARAWGCTIQLLRASFQDNTSSDSHEQQHQHQQQSNAIVWPAFGVHDEFPSSSPVVAMEWLNDRSLVYLTVQNEFTVVDTVIMTLVEKIDCSGISLVYAEFSLSRSSQDNNNKNNNINNNSGQQEQKLQDPKDDHSPVSSSFCTTFQNSIRSRDNRLLLLCQEELQSVSIVGAKRRISQLEQDGEWLEALASALDHYESTVMSQQDRRRELKKDLTKHPEYSSSTGNGQIVLSPDEEWIAKLLIRYINIAMENAPELSDYELAQSHFQMLAGVCVEFCVVTKRLDLLYGPIFRRFHAVGCLAVFLDVLEPYILNDKLDYIAPEAMAHFVEHCRLHNGMSTVERCLLHMDVTIMDFDSILTLLKANEMYSALFYVYNQGLNDYTSPLEILMEKIFDASDTVISSTPGGSVATRHIKQQQQHLGRKIAGGGAPKNDLEKYGYKAILYLQYCFEGRAFPQNIAIEDDQRLSQIRSDLLAFLLQETFEPKSIRKHSQVLGQRTQRYPYTYILLLVDPIAMLQTLCLAMDAPDSFYKAREASLESIGGWEVEVGTDRSSHARSTRAPDRQDIIRMLLSIVLPEEYSGMSSLTKRTAISVAPGHLSRSQPTINALLDFLANYLMKGVVRANKNVTHLILNRMASRFESAVDAHDRLQSQQRILELLTSLPHNSYEPEEVLVLVQKSGIHRAALLLHQEGASSWGIHTESLQELEHRAYHFKAAIDCYLDDDDPDFCKEVFSYVKKECSGISSDYQQSDLKDETYEPNSLRTALACKLVDLVQLDSLLTSELVAELFADDLDSVVSQLHDEQAQFLFFQAIISGDLDQKDQVAGAVLNANLTVDHHHRYLELMAKLHPDDVYEYLQTHDSYRPETCLPLCQKYDIADASCYLLERMGNVSSGLQLILQTLESRMMGLKRIIRGMGTTSTYSRYISGIRHHKLVATSNSVADTLMGATEREIQGVKRILIVALDLCERNSGTFSSRTEHGSQLWFNVLDRLINAKGFLRLSKEQPGHARIMAGVLSDLLRLVMQRMVSSVPLPDLVRKVTSDHSGSRLGELREMVESLLSTYGFELTLFEGAVSVFHHDMKQMRSRNRSLRIRGDRVSSIVNAPISDSTNTSHRRWREEISTSSPISTATNAFEGENQGLGTALLKLQRRRRQTQRLDKSSSFSTSRHPGHSATINLMPESERRIFVNGEENPEATYWEDRVAGLLGAAENSGRFRSFLY